jgi:prevent-host-death family protein
VTKTVNIHEAKTHLSRLLEEAVNGEDIVIAKAGKPKVRLVPVEPRPKRRLGFMPPGWGSLPDSFFFDPLPEEELRLWEGGD